MKFYLGTHKIGWLARTSHPLFISHRQARSRKTPLISTAEFCVDSGGYSELSMHGRWTIGLAEYVDAIGRYQSWGGLEWVAPQDWMTEPEILAATGKSVREHHELTVQSYLDLRAAGVPVIPVLQGPHLPDYHRHADMYAAAGVDLTTVGTVGVGSVCRREGTLEAEQIFRELHARGFQLHGFGVKVSGLRRYHEVLKSADSLAWSFGARREASRARRAGRVWSCAYGPAGHASCANCLPYALAWRGRTIAGLD